MNIGIDCTTNGCVARSLNVMLLISLIIGSICVASAAQNVLQTRQMSNDKWTNISAQPNLSGTRIHDGMVHYPNGTTIYDPKRDQMNRKKGNYQALPSSKFKDLVLVPTDTYVANYVPAVGESFYYWQGAKRLALPEGTIANVEEFDDAETKEPAIQVYRVPLTGGNNKNFNQIIASVPWVNMTEYGEGYRVTALDVLDPRHPETEISYSFPPEAGMEQAPGNKIYLGAINSQGSGEMGDLLLTLILRPLGNKTEFKWPSSYNNLSLKTPTGIIVPPTYSGDHMENWLIRPIDSRSDEVAFAIYRIELENNVEDYLKRM